MTEKDLSSVVITIPGKPVAWARAGVRVVKAGGKTFAQHYTNNQTRSFEQRVAECGRRALGNKPPFDCPVVVAMLFRREPPKSVNKAARAAMLAGQTAPSTKPDLTNYAKGVEDALNGIAFVDDSLIVEIHLSKAYAETAGIDVLIRPWTPRAIEREAA